MSKVVAVVASNREKMLQTFLSVWTPPPWDCLVVVEDGPHRSFDLATIDPQRIQHVSWAEIATDADIVEPSPFSRRDAAIKMYGFWAALRMHADIIVALDDDCHPFGSPDSFTTDHVSALSPRNRWVPSVDDSPTRGLPYFDLGKIDGGVANMGLWRGAADHDAAQRLALHRLGYLDASYSPQIGNRLIHPQNYWPFCGMNIAFRRDVAPLMYMPKMGEGSPYSRFDDIWCGIILQRCCRHLGLMLSVGDPHVRHVPVSDPLTRLEKEAPGIRANELFWKVVEATPLQTARHFTPLTCAEAVAAHFTWAGENDLSLAENTVLASYLIDEGARMRSWCQMFRRAAWE
jgi:hypothetical protein